jgi:hypothetical protein
MILLGVIRRPPRVLSMKLVTTRGLTMISATAMRAFATRLGARSSPIETRTARCRACRPDLLARPLHCDDDADHRRQRPFDVDHASMASRAWSIVS